MALVLGSLCNFSCPCAKSRPCASKALMRARTKPATPRSALDAKSSSTTGSAPHLKHGSYFRRPKKALRRQRRCWWLSASKSRNNWACTIGLVATSLCISWEVGMGGESCSMLRGRQPNGSNAPCAKTWVSTWYVSAKLLVNNVEKKAQTFRSWPDPCVE